jgi:hypothetical protein
MHSAAVCQLTLLLCCHVIVAGLLLLCCHVIVTCPLVLPQLEYIQQSSIYLQPDCNEYILAA